MHPNKIFHHFLSFFYFFLFKTAPGPKIKKNPKKAIYLTPFAIKYDGRVRKSIDALLAKGYLVELIKPKDAKEEIKPWHINLSITPLGLSGSYTHFPYVLDWEVMKYLRHANTSSVYCRDIFTGIMGVLDAHSTGKKVIVDFYEWYSETKEYNYINQLTMPMGLWKKKLFKFYERYICKNANKLITNNKSFAKGISQGCVSPDKFTIIRNIPDSGIIDSTQFNLRHLLPQFAQNKKILYYIGQLSFDRKLDTLILGMKELHDCVLIIQGTSYLETQRIYSKELEMSQASDRIFFFPPVSDKHIVSYANSADLGIFICDSKDKKMYNALPNKLFEYVFSGIPQVSSKGAEIDNIIKREKIGLLFDAYSPQSFTKAVEEILGVDKYRNIKEAVLNYRERLYVEKDFEKIA